MCGSVKSKLVLTVMLFMVVGCFFSASAFAQQMYPKKVCKKVRATNGKIIELCRTHYVMCHRSSRGTYCK